MTPTAMTRTRFLGVVGVWALIVAAACSGDVTALSGCTDQTKFCAVAGQYTCVPKDDPTYGCGNENTCLSCAALGFVHVKAAGCDIIRRTCAVSECDDNYKHCPGSGPESGGCETAIASDPNNCGECGHVCGPLVPNGTGACIQRLCVASCSIGFTDCDKQFENGCECHGICSGTTCVPIP
jgi:hypothetical protein